jgi:LURP-one-related
VRSEASVSVSTSCGEAVMPNPVPRTPASSRTSWLVLCSRCAASAFASALASPKLSYATVKKALVSPLRDRFSIELEGGGELSAKGNVVDHEYEIERAGEEVAEVSKRWFRVRDTYGIEIEPGEDAALILASTVCIDQMARG